MRMQPDGCDYYCDSYGPLRGKCARSRSSYLSPGQSLSPGLSRFRFWRTGRLLRHKFLIFHHFDLSDQLAVHFIRTVGQTQGAGSGEQTSKREVF